MPIPLELGDMQRLILESYRERPRSRFALLEVVDVAQAREWLGQAVARVGTADRRREDSGGPDASLALAFTYPGLLKLGLGRARGFLAPFREGLAHEGRSQDLGDTGTSEPSHWRWGGPSHRETLHLLVMLYSSEDRLEEAWGSLAPGLGFAQQIALLDGFLGTTEHFGFRDGISQPYIEGSGTSRRPRGRHAELATVKPGEFVLGYLNEANVLPPTPTVPDDLDRLGQLPSCATQLGRRDFGRNGSYLVVRQLRQDVAAFESFLDRHEAHVQGGRELVAAKLVGRWRSGAPLVSAKAGDAPELAVENDFTFFDEDRYGHACPIGAHIRRANPRDSLVDEERGVSRELAAARSRRHRLIRRGRLYHDGEEKGLLFLCLNANLESQFEFVQHNWIAAPNFGGLSGETDPLIGPRSNGNEHLTLQAPGGARKLDGLRRFVDVVGGGYFFLPGIRALRFLATPPDA